ncbi:hypothetical protein VT84_24720 [Gemmata sp. SH-PL17]|uniref:hypothetical protein n=1 Tax=Gemmata sp. SH-PL17 TaxID=1630693 RepID=UPI0004ACF405|nr:hypothetical protein [Gemmata sp. SH-PL17]AMV27629.1 hypothetical protein VT84_24720 [Gemmata sp. SH-PL17]
MRIAARLAMLCAGLSFVGCGFAQKPYTNDPLLRRGRAVWLSRDPVPANPPFQPSVIEPPSPPAELVTSPWE